MKFVNGFGFTKEVEAILELLGGAEGLSKLDAYGLENYASGIMFRIAHERLQLYAVMCVIPDGKQYIVFAHYTDRNHPFKEVCVSPHELRHTVESLCSQGVKQNG